ncbi:MAG: pyridoxamine 5'-phosphate oxidase [Saprospiraceae bacterium]|nr:pyridoxamine 5'-phosphate oxidase [Saprospiraceae bacterium]
MEGKKLTDLRRNYDLDHLAEETASKDPYEQFESWLAAAVAQELEVEPNAMVLSTANEVGEPAGRVVLLKGISNGGFIFFSNYTSNKGLELSQNPKCALTFWWQHSHRQVRIAGRAEKVSHRDSETYFSSRPLGSQLGAIVSPQSRVIKDRTQIEKDYDQLAKEYNSDLLPEMPSHWGGYKVIPYKMEFWQGRTNRLHDRLRYQLEDGKWHIERLAP